MHDFVGNLTLQRLNLIEVVIRTKYPRLSNLGEYKISQVACREFHNLGGQIIGTDT